MSAHPELEALETGGPEIDRHVEQCAGCAREVAWLRAEKALMARRPAPAVDHLWAGVEARIGLRGPEVSPRRRPHWARRVALGAAGFAAAAAVVLLAIRTRPATVRTETRSARLRDNQYHPDPKALAALDRAEADYRDAAKVLEAEYDRLRPHLDPALASRWDETLTRARTQLVESRGSVAAEDLNARMQVMDGYARYLRSLRNVVQNVEELNP